MSASVARFDFFSKLNLESASLGDSKLQVSHGSEISEPTSL